MDTAIARIITAEPDQVWTHLTAFERYPDTVGSYVSVEFLSQARTGIGARWRQTRTVFGRSHTQELAITEWDQPRLLVTEAAEAGARYRTSYQLTQATDGGTQVDVHFTVAATNVFARIVQRLMGRKLLASTRTAMITDLDDLATTIEQSPKR